MSQSIPKANRRVKAVVFIHDLDILCSDLFVEDVLRQGARSSSCTKFEERTSWAVGTRGDFIDSETELEELRSKGRLRSEEDLAKSPCRRDETAQVLHFHKSDSGADTDNGRGAGFGWIGRGQRSRSGTEEAGRD